MEILIAIRIFFNSASVAAPIPDIPVAFPGLWGPDQTYCGYLDGTEFVRITSDAIYSEDESEDLVQTVKIISTLHIQIEVLAQSYVYQDKTKTVATLSERQHRNLVLSADQKNLKISGYKTGQIDRLVKCLGAEPQARPTHH